MEIQEKVNYWAKVGFVSTLNGPRDISTANVLILRCNIFEWGQPVPLAVKVYWNRRTHGDKAPEVGDTILVQAYRKHNHESIRFRPVTIRSTFKREDKPMAMSKDRVRFFVGERYFAVDSARIKIGKVMARAFGISAMASDSWLKDGGVWVTCRPSQFARFMIYRNEAGITNGFMDLRAELVKPASKDFYTRLSALTGVDRHDIKQVIQALNFSVPELEKQISEAESQRVTELDVSESPA